MAAGVGVGAGAGVGVGGRVSALLSRPRVLLHHHHLARGECRMRDARDEEGQEKKTKS